MFIPIRLKALGTPTYRAPAASLLLMAMVLGSGSTSILAQGLGSVDLPVSLAEEGTQVMGVLNRDPGDTTRFLNYSEGPAVDANDTLYFAEFFGDSSQVWKVPPQGKAMIFHQSGYRTNGMEFDQQGRLFACQNGAIRILKDKGLVIPLAESDTFGVTNDLTIGNKGALYFSNWGDDVFFLSAAGKVTKISGFRISNGLEWIEEKKLLFVAQDGPDLVYRYEVKDDGTLANGKPFAAIKEPDGMTMDERGNLYVASYTEGAVIVLDSTGKQLGRITVTNANPLDKDQDRNTSNCVFGGIDGKTLYITGEGGAYKVRLKVAGRKRGGTVVGVRHPAASGRLGKGRPSAGRVFNAVGADRTKEFKGKREGAVYLRGPAGRAGDSKP